MTTEEAILWMQGTKIGWAAMGYIAGATAGDMAIAALRAQQERENPEPLTLDELRQMVGKPVYTTKYGWKICYGVTNFTGEPCMETGAGWRVSLCDYGKTWLAYRHKPKEGSK